MGTNTTGIQWKNVRVKLGDLKPWSRNPRMSSKAQAERILKSFDEFGQVETVAIGPNGEVYDGHQRLSALLTVHGDKHEIDARKASRALTEKERERLVLMLHAGATGAWDWDALSNWDAALLEQSGFDDELLKQLNRDSSAIMELLGMGSEDEQGADAEPQIDKAEELREKWGVKLGQMWALDSHRLLCGDSTNPADVERVMGGEKATMIYADPPYGIKIVAANGFVGGGEAFSIPFGGKKSKRLGSIGGAKPFGSKTDRNQILGSDGAKNLVAVGKYAPIIGDDSTDTAIKSSCLLLEMYPKATHIWWGANHYADKLKASSCWLVWNKETTGNFSDCELAWTNQNKAARLFTHRWNGMLRDSERERRIHPSQKPVALAVWCFREIGSDGDIVLDPFSGCAPSIIACEQTGRKCRAIEMSEDYVAVALSRWADATGKTPILCKP